MVDVTARKETEQRPVDVERLYRNLVEQLPVATWIADAHLTRLTYLSPQAESLLGYPLSASLDDPGFWLRSVHHEDRPRVEQTIAAAVAVGGSYVNEFRQFTGDGRTAWIRDVGRPVRDEGGAIVNWLGVVQDITEQREVGQRLVEAEVQARAADRRYRTLVEQLPAVVWT
jgi:PAS domain S-box-containing protein